MRISRLILEQKESILQDFEDFARAYTSPGPSMDIAALRDHAAGMLEAFALDLERPQTEAEQEQKSKGKAPCSGHAGFTAAQEHGSDRAQSGFSLEEAIAEYRALRASVLRHLAATVTGSPLSEVQDITRFNEAIDQAIAESTHEYSKVVTDYRDMFLAMLGHDLRSPLNAVMSASAVLEKNGELSDRDLRLVRIIQSSGGRMMDLINDMLDFTSSRFGHGIPIRPQAADLGEIVAEAVRVSQVTHTPREFRIMLAGDLTGKWDVGRLRQAISNLLDNAVQHGSPDSPITVRVSALDASGDLIVAVHNLGPVILAGERERIFDPFRRGSSRKAQTEEHRRGIGLGLYIAREVAEAHGGRLEVESIVENGTTFSLRLARRPVNAEPD